MDYTNCPCCGSQLTEDGMSYKGKLINSQKTCRNVNCPMFDWTLSPREHVIKAQDIKKGKTA